MKGDIVVEKGDYYLKDLPPGFRFHPTDEEIITYYLKQKVINHDFTPQAIGEVDLNKCEPWDLPKRAKMKGKEYFFFYRRDRKYATGMRTNRATKSGYWKATGKDKEILKEKGNLVGMKKTLVFYKGRAPKGEKTNWIMHEFRLEGTFSSHSMPHSKEEWVVSKIFHKMASKGDPIIGELVRVDSLVNHLLNSPPLPSLMEMNTADNDTNMNRYQACYSSNPSAANPTFNPGNTYQSIGFACQEHETRPGKFPGYYPGSESNQAFSRVMNRKECKVEQFSTNNSMVSHSQDTGLAADFEPPETSSMALTPRNHFDPEKAFEGLEFLLSDPIIAESDS